MKLSNNRLEQSGVCKAMSAWRHLFTGGPVLNGGVISPE